MGSTTDIDLGLGLPSTLSLGSPFHTPTAKRVASNLRIDGTVTPPFSTPRRRPRGPSLLATSPGGGHKRNLSIGDVFARMTAVAAAAAAAEAAEGTEVEATGTRDDLHVVGFGDLPAEVSAMRHETAAGEHRPKARRSGERRSTWPFDVVQTFTGSNVWFRAGSECARAAKPSQPEPD